MRYLDVVVGPRGGADVYRVARDRPNVGFWEEGMRFGFFDQLPCAPGYSEPQRYKDILAQIELGDAVGFDTVWLGEIHFIREFSILADPLMVLAAAAQRTSRIRLGTAVTLLPLHSPIKIADSAATFTLNSASVAVSRDTTRAMASRPRRAAGASTRRSISFLRRGQTTPFPL